MASWHEERVTAAEEWIICDRCGLLRVEVDSHRCARCGSSAAWTFKNLEKALIYQRQVLDANRQRKP